MYSSLGWKSSFSSNISQFSQKHSPSLTHDRSGSTPRKIFGLSWPAKRVLFRGALGDLPTLHFGRTTYGWKDIWVKFHSLGDQDDDLRAWAQILQNLQISPSTFKKLHLAPTCNLNSNLTSWAWLVTFRSLAPTHSFFLFYDFLFFSFF